MTTSELPQKNIIITIILSESATDVLKLDLPRIENIYSTDSSSEFYLIKADDPRNFHQESLPNSTETEEISSEIAYFSIDRDLNESTTSLSDSSTSLIEPEVPHELTATKIYVRPLAVMTGDVNQIEVKNEFNVLHIAVSGIELIADSSWTSVCRICHGGESIADLLTPCGCRGSIASAHLQCLERWLRESATSHCELCQHHYQVVREPKYSVPWSVVMFLRHPGEHYRELLLDLIAFLIYTPTAVGTTYMLMLLCEGIAKTNMAHGRNVSAHVMAFTAVFGMAAIDFTYSSWLMVSLQKHADSWRVWYRNNCDLKLILPEQKKEKRKSPGLSMR